MAIKVIFVNGLFKINIEFIMGLTVAFSGHVDIIAMHMEIMVCLSLHTKYVCAVRAKNANNFDTNLRGDGEN